jgi:hypothetical protein
MSGHQHPVCGHTQGTNIKDGTSALHASPKPGSRGHISGSRKVVHLRTLVFDGEQLDRLFRSAAYLNAVARYITVQPMEAGPGDSLGVRFFSAVVPDRYHTREIVLPDEKQLQEKTHEGANQFGELFWKELEERGSAGAKAFLEDVEAQRENAQRKIAKTYRDATDYNQHAEKAQENIYHGLVLVKCASTIIVAGITLPVIPVAAASLGWASAASAGGLAAFGVGTGYGISLAVIKNWDKADEAQLVLIAKDKAVSKTEQKAGKEVAKFAQKIAESESGNPKDIAKTLGGKHWLVKRIEDAGDAAKKAKLLRRLDRKMAAAQAARNAGRLATVLKAVPYLFFAWSAASAVSDAHQEW